MDPDLTEKKKLPIYYWVILRVQQLVQILVLCLTNILLDQPLKSKIILHYIRDMDKS